MSAEPAPTEPLQILVVDDDKNLAQTIAESLERRGHECTVATTGKAGAAKIEQGEFDVVLTDLSMPDIVGVSAITQLLRTQQPELPILVLTMHEDDAHVFAALSAGARLPRQGLRWRGDRPSVSPALRYCRPIR